MLKIRILGYDLQSSYIFCVFQEFATTFVLSFRSKAEESHTMLGNRRVGFLSE
jgi:hypothetical protein